MKLNTFKTMQVTMQYGINSTFMQMYSSLIDYSNEICKEDQRNII